MWLQVIGWAGSILLVYSVLQVRVMRFRVANLASCVVLAFFNASIQAWPMVGMNTALTLINAYFIVKLLRGKKAGRAFEFVLVDAQDPVVGWFMQRHWLDIAEFHPRLVDQLDPPAGAAALEEAGSLPQAALVFHDNAAVGLMVFRTEPNDASFGYLLADYVIPAYRDYTPGAFVFSPQGPLAMAGIKHICSDASMPAVTKYLSTMGFANSGDGRMSRSI